MEYDGKIYAMAGCVDDQDLTCTAITNSMEIYDIKTNTWKDGPPMPNARYRHVSVLAAPGLIWVLFG